MEFKNENFMTDIRIGVDLGGMRIKAVAIDEQGNIPKQMPKEGREMANFLALIVDTTTKNKPTTLTTTEIRCFKKG